MARTNSPSGALAELFDKSPLPIYAIDADRRIVYCNAALADWLELDRRQIVGHLVEYHSETDGSELSRDAPGLLVGLCPPPAALAGDVSTGTVSCVARDGRLRHRQADFLALGDQNAGASRKHAAAGADAIFTILARCDLSPQELAVKLTENAGGDLLHRAIRQFRRAQAARFATSSLLGTSSGMRKVRSQVTAAAACGANVLIIGRKGSGRGHVARAIHYLAAADPSVRLVPIDARITTDDSLRRAIDALGGSQASVGGRGTLLVEEIEHLWPTHQAALLELCSRDKLSARLIATTTETEKHVDAQGEDHSPGPGLLPALRDVIATLTIQLPSLVERTEDLPLLAQYFLEAANRDNPKQVGSLSHEALDLLALYSWPDELDELRDVIISAHRAAAMHEITAADLPPLIHHAAKAAALPRRQPSEPIDLDELLKTIEKEAIRRALEQARGNKSEAAELLGLTRPRLYRRMEQLGLVTPVHATPSPDNGSLLPDFQEIEPEGQDA
jgi:DNA-binding NtrC family response regulator